MHHDVEFSSQTNCLVHHIIAVMHSTNVLPNARIGGSLVLCNGLYFASSARRHDGCIYAFIRSRPTKHCNS